ncbi:MAG: ImmA/IrrE family metallo-endopeptidase [Candidatus Thiodiazotropha endolucinida]
MQKIRAQAEKVLWEYQIRRPPIPVSEIAKDLGASVRYSPYEGELAGMLIRGEGQTIIGVNSLHHGNRQRFTISHEIGHLLLHDGDAYIDRSFRINKRDSTSSKASDREEIEANRFAAELLMPYSMLKADLSEYEIDIEDEEDIKELALRYKVSIQAMTHRITNILDDILKERY